MKKLLLIAAALIVLGASAFATDLKTGVSYFTFTAAMDTAATPRSFIRNDTLYTPWYYVGDYKRIRIAVQRIPYPLNGYKDSSWSTNVNDTTKLLIQHAFSARTDWGVNATTGMGTEPRAIGTIPVDSSLTNSAVIDTTVVFTAAQTNLLNRDSSAVIGDWIRGMVVVHDSTKTTIASSGLVGNKYARQFLFWINGLRYSDKQN